MDFPKRLQRLDAGFGDRFAEPEVRRIEPTARDGVIDLMRAAATVRRVRDAAVLRGEGVERRARP